MRDLFSGWVPLDEDSLDQYWREATFAVDTSVLLDLYRFSEETRRGLLDALRSFGDRLWIPHQVALEFHRNRFNVLLAQREAEGNLLSGLDQIKGDLIKQLSERLKGAGRRDLAPLEEAIDSGFERLRENLKEAEKAHTKGLGQETGEDPIYEEVVNLFADRVGSPFDAKEQEAVVADAEKRFKSKSPPGFLDSEKEGEERYGDVVLWHQLCRQAEETAKPVVLVSDDQKEDWIWRVRGRTLGPRPELVEEMQRRAGMGFHIYSPTRFIQVWKQREEGQEVKPEVLAEIEESSKESPAEGSFAGVLRSLVEVWAQKNREGQASHRVEGSRVHLMFQYRPTSPAPSPPSAIVTVRSGQGEENKALTYPINADASRQLYTYSMGYPTQFREGELSAGVYEVVWEAQAVLDGTLGGPQEVARDYFTIGASSSNG